MKAIAVRKHNIVIRKHPNHSSNLSSGALVSCFGSKQIIPALFVQKMNYSGMNEVVQFAINNSLPGNTNTIVRIGGLVALPNVFAQFNVPLGSANKGTISDEYGIGCRKVQGFSELVNKAPVFVKTIKISCNKDTQLQRLFTYNTIRYDSSINSVTQNIGFTAEKSDALTTLAVARGNWIIGFNQYFEFTILQNIECTIFLELAAVASVKAFSTIGDR